MLDSKQMPGQRYPVLDWPYVEGLRIDEAVHPLAILAVGLYGKPLPNQNGAPLRLVVPWKYGFKSIKSIVRIRFVERMPKTSWALSAPNEYGFFANVNPEVDHPRWSQKSERRIGTTQLPQPPADAQVQRLRGRGGGPLSRHGPRALVLTAMNADYRARRYAKPIVFLLCLWPAAWLVDRTCCPAIR